MKTQDFIASNMFTPTAQRKCSHVWEEYPSFKWDKQFESYGFHYPLLYRKDDSCFINDQGWSNTTCKHIKWAHGAVRDNGLAAYSFNNSKGRTVGEAILNELTELREKLPHLRSNAFRKKEAIKYRVGELERSWLAYNRLFPINS